ncbi:MAG: M23 family metallopeptidase, partial [Nitrospira sp.]|nr:M23 family metallopeptidase [Nitrospira sp.]
MQKLTLPKEKVDLDAKTLKRVKAEQKEMAGAFHHTNTDPLWNGPFLEPVNGKITGVFGSRRIINGQPRRPHSGEDIAAPKGTPVLAINSGTV